MGSEENIKKLRLQKNFLIKITNIGKNARMLIFIWLNFLTNFIKSFHVIWRNKNFYDFSISTLQKREIIDNAGCQKATLSGIYYE